MEPTYLLWSGRLQGWLTKTSTYSSDLEQAQEFSRSAALEMVKRHRDRANYNLLPVMKDDLQ